MVNFYKSEGMKGSKLELKFCIQIGITGTTSSSNSMTENNQPNNEFNQNPRENVHWVNSEQTLAYQNAQHPID